MSSASPSAARRLVMLRCLQCVVGQGPGGGADVHTHARPRTCDAEAQTERALQQPNIEDAAERESASENNSFNSAADELALSFARRRSSGYGRCSSDAGITAEDMDKMLAAVEAVAEDQKTKDSSTAFALGTGFGIGFGTRARVLQGCKLLMRAPPRQKPSLLLSSPPRRSVSTSKSGRAPPSAWQSCAPSSPASRAKSFRRGRRPLACAPMPNPPRSLTRS